MTSEEGPAMTTNAEGGEFPGATPRPYQCTCCGNDSVRLWRESNTFADQTDLLCVDCCEERSGRKCELPTSDQIGWWLPAVAASGGTFWGYTSVPEERVKWWHDRPLRNRFSELKAETRRLEQEVARLKEERDRLLSIKRLFTHDCNKIIELIEWSKKGNGNLDLEWAADQVGNALSNAHLIDIGAYRPGVFMPTGSEEVAK